MIIKVKDKTIIYHATPKCGCSSVKNMLFFMKNKTSKLNFESAHVWFPSHLFKNKHHCDFRFCVVRGPVERFISGYSNRIIYHRDIPPVKFDKFVNNFFKFYKNEKIKHHFRPQVDYIGHDPLYYTNIFWVHEMQKVSDFLSDISGIEVPVLHKQTGGRDKKPAPTEEQIKFIKDFYKKDYEFLGKIAK